MRDLAMCGILWSVGGIIFQVHTWVHTIGLIDGALTVG